MHKILTYGSFAIASLIVTAAFVTSTTYTQLIVAVLLYPPLVCFAFKIFPRKAQCYLFSNPVANKSQPLMRQAEKAAPAKTENTLGIADIDKRVFLKLIGGVGLSLFLFSIFNKKAEGMFFKNTNGLASGVVALEDETGKKIDPARNQPTDGFNIAEIDEGALAFYGFTNKDGAWFIMRQDDEAGSFRYSRGDNNFPLSWKNRKNLKYDYFNAVF